MNICIVNAMTLALRLIEKREAAGLTQAQLGEMAGVTQQTIHAIEKGLTHNPRKIKALARVLRTTGEYLQYGVAPENTEARQHRRDPALDALMDKTKQLANAGELSSQQIATIRSVLELVTGTTRTAYTGFAPSGIAVTKKQTTA